MEQVSTAFAEALARKTKQPVFIAVFDGIATRYSTGPVLNPSGTTVQIMNPPTGGGASVTMDKGTSSISSVSFDLLDKAQQITELIGAFNLYNRKVTLKAGFADIPEAFYATMFTGRVEDFCLNQDNISWSFQLSSLLRDQKQDIITALTTLSALITPIQATITVAATLTFATLAKVGSATSSKFYIKIDDEVISYTGMTATQFTGCARGLLGTAAAQHEVAAKVNPFIVLNGAPIDIILMILTSTGTSVDGVTAGTNGAYDLLPEHCGLGISSSLVASSAMVRQQSTWLAGFLMQFELSEREEAKKFIEEEIYQWINGYPFVDNNGLMTCKIYSAPLATSPMFVLNDDNMIGPPKWAGNPTARMFFNEVDLKYDWDHATGNLTSELLYEDTVSQTTFGRTTTKEGESRGLRTSVTGLTRITRFAKRFVKRFGKASPILQVKAFYMAKTIEIGDFVLLTSTKIPDITTGKMGVSNRIMEVIKTDMNYLKGEMSMELCDTGYSYGLRTFVIAPRNYPNYLAATAQQRNYGFISRLLSGSTTVGVMSNGDPGYTITP